MTRKAIDAENLARWVQVLIDSGRRVIAPVYENGTTVFKPISRAGALPLPTSVRAVPPYGKTDLSLKEWLFPPTEPILHYRFDDGDVVLEDPEVEAVETVALFLRPCDAAAFSVLDKVFISDYEDAFYTIRRRNLTVVGLSCIEPQPECFCPAVGLSPTSEKGSDILLTPLDGRFLVEVLTEKGQRLVDERPDLFTDADGLTKEQVTAEAMAKITRKEPLVGELPFESDAWEELARKCLGCGVCAYVCPTCHCYDIVDEATAFAGCRCKNWDSCAFALFTLHASGHNPRPTQAHRYRQRVMHKFCYFLQTFGQNMCVGCGRCVVKCPVGMDIYEVVRQVSKQALAESQR